VAYIIVRSNLMNLIVLICRMSYNFQKGIGVSGGIGVKVRIGVQVILVFGKM